MITDRFKADGGPEGELADRAERGRLAGQAANLIRPGLSGS
jgi:hypothetical protein